MSQESTNRSFDDLARALAEGSINRRGALKLFAGTAISALIPSRALAQPEKVTICHKPGTPDEQTIEVSQRAVASHQRHGDREGPCVTTTTTSTSTSTSTTSTSTSTSTTTPTSTTSTSTTTPTTSTSTSTTSTTPMCIPDFEEGCTDDTQCCSDICDLSGTTGICLPCRVPGDFCTDGRECCFGLCENGICCRSNGDPCTEDIICCSGLCDGEMCSPCQNANDCRPPASQCKQATCNNGVCGEEDVLDGTLCDDDQNPCTIGVCTAGVCVSTVIECSGDPCTTDDDCCDCATCVEGECQSS